MTLTDDEAAEAVIRQGFGNPKDFGPKAPTTISALLDMVREHRMRGFSLIRDVYAPGMSSMSAPVQRRGEGISATVVIAGPSIRFTEDRMLACGADLLATAGELALLGGASSLMESDGGTWGNRG